MTEAKNFLHEINEAILQGSSESRARALWHATDLLIAGRYTEALPEAQRAYANAPDMEMVQLALGRSMGETGNIDGGVQMLEKVLKTDPDNLEAHIGLAALFAGDWPEVAALAGEERGCDHPRDGEGRHKMHYDAGEVVTPLASG